MTEKWGGYIVRKIHSLYRPFVLYSLIYLVFRQGFIKIGILSGNKFSFADNIIAVTNILTFNGVGEFLAAFWFLPVMFITMIVYSFLSRCAKKISGEFSDAICFCLCILVGLIGLYTTQNNFGLLYNMQIAYLMVFVVEIGCLFRKYENCLFKFINVASLIISLGILCGVIHANIGIIELSKNMIINQWCFYPITIVGLVFCLSFAKVLGKNKLFGKAVSYIGENSFDIMALHFLGFKIVDYFASYIIGTFEDLGAFPYTYSFLWPIYYVVGIGFPIIVKKTFVIVTKRLTIRLSNL